MATETTKRRMPLWAKIVIWALVAVIILCAALVGAVAIVWRHEIASVASFTKVADRNEEHLDGAVYRMDISGDFYFDDYLAQGGASGDSELIDFITKNITRGLIDMTISESEIACSSFTAVTADGDRIFARNYDFARTNTALVFADPGNGRHKSFSTVDL